jgi:hypothetical protein
MTPQYEELIKKLMLVCESIVSEAYVVSDGIRTSAIVLDKTVAEFLCREMRKKYQTDSWDIFSIPQAIENAFNCGRESAMKEIESLKRKEETETK